MTRRKHSYHYRRLISHERFRKNSLHSAPIMEKATHTATSGQDDDVPVVTGRKAARSLRLFLGNGRGYDLAIAESLAAESKTTESMLELSPDPETNPSLQILEPVSSATYFPHTPLKTIPKTVAIAPDEVSPDTAPLQHLTADLEFERGLHGELTNIKKHLHDWTSNSLGINDTPEAESDKEGSSKVQPGNEIYPLTVELRPFKNKVGGHTAIFRFSKKAVCKALVNRENVWYEAVERKHLNLLKFMPKYIGVLNVRYSSIVREEEFTPKIGPVDEPFDIHPGTSVGSTTVDDITHELQNLQVFKPSSKPYKCTSNPHLRRPSFPGFQALRGDDFEDLPPEVLLDDNRHIIPDLLWKHYSTSAPNATTQKLMKGASHNSRDFPEHDTSLGSTSVNTDLQAQIIQEVFVPQSRKPDDIFQMEDDYSEQKGSDSEELQNPVLRKHTRFERFILLEDLTADMTKPCVLDLKMGTRQYGVEASDLKQASQRKKCSLTSSKELGTRVCGLQVWNQATQKYFMKDKYFGRKLRSGAPFAKALAKFLYDGTCSYSIICKIPPIIRLLKELYRDFQDLKGFRMYGSSILLMYDGALSARDAQIKIHIIDFAQSVIGDDADYHSYKKPPKHPELADMGYLKGLRSLITYFKAIFEILTGDVNEEVDNMDAYLEDQSKKFTAPQPWTETFGENDEEDINKPIAGDPFDVFAQFCDPAETSD